jgi:hypothetical protein
LIDSSSCSQGHGGIQSWQDVPAKSIAKCPPSLSSEGPPLFPPPIKLVACGSCADRRPQPVPEKAAAASPSSGRLHPQTELASTFPCTYPSSPACPSSPQSPTSPAQGRGGHRRWSPAPPPRRPSPCPTEPRNQPSRTRGSIPTRARPAPASGSPEFGRTAATGARGRHCKICDFSGEFCAK